MADVIKSFISTQRTCTKRRLNATKDPTHAHQLAQAKASFALSMAKLRVLRQYDKQGQPFMQAIREAVSARHALISCLNYNPGVKQMSLDL